MSNILHNYSLKNHNTFGVDAKAKHFASFTSEEELTELLKDNICKKLVEKDQLKAIKFHGNPPKILPLKNSIIEKINEKINIAVIFFLKSNLNNNAIINP